MLYICIFSNKFDLKQTIRVLHKPYPITFRLITGIHSLRTFSNQNKAIFP